MTTDQYRICPENPKVIERRLPSPVYPWGFYKVCDSPADAKRSLKTLSSMEDAKQGDPWEPQSQ